MKFDLYYKIIRFGMSANSTKVGKDSDKESVSGAETYPKVSVLRILVDF